MSDKDDNNDFYDDNLYDGAIDPNASPSAMEDEFIDDGFIDDEFADEGFEDDFSENTPSDQFMDTPEEPFSLEQEEDEFAGEFDEEGDWDDEGIEAEGAFVSEGAGMQKEKKGFLPNMSFNAMVITGAVIVGFGVLAFQVMTTKSPITIDSFKSALNMGGAADGPVFGDAAIDSTQIATNSNEDTQNQGFLFNPEMLDDLSTEDIDKAMQDAPPMPTPMATTEVEAGNSPAPSLAGNDILNRNPVPRPPEGESNLGQLDELQMLQQVTGRQQPAPVEAAQEIKIEPIKEVTPAIQTIPEPVEPTEVERQAEAKPEAPAPSLPETVTAEKKVEAAPEAPPKTQVQPDFVASGVNSDISAKLDMIMSRLDDMEVQITQVREVGNSKIEDVAKDLTSLKQDVGNIAATPNPVKAAAKTTAKPPAVVKKAEPKKKVVKRAPAPSWELRAAQPGKAWVSKKGQKDMQPVVVGDSLSGIGRITNISYDGQRWTVKGTSGQILQ